MKNQNVTVIYEHDFDTALGMFEINGHKSDHRADFYDVSKDTEKHLQTLNAMLKGLTTSPGEDIISYLLRIEQLNADIGKYILKNFQDPKKVKVNSNHGRGLEAGVEAILKAKFK